MAAGRFSELYPAKMLNLDESTVLECYESGYRYDYVLALKSHPCIFLGKDNRCRIHKLAPFTCRRYPVSQNGRIFERAPCNPISKLMFAVFGVHMTCKEHMTQIERYRAIVAKWNKKHGKKEDCIDFLIAESKSNRLK
jgi:Fe-S-cluster containining protein